MAELSWQAEPIPLWYHKGMSRQGLRAIVTQELCAIVTQELWTIVTQELWAIVAQQAELRASVAQQAELCAIDTNRSSSGQLRHRRAELCAIVIQTELCGNRVPRLSFELCGSCDAGGSCHESHGGALMAGCVHALVVSQGDE